MGKSSAPDPGPAAAASAHAADLGFQLGTAQQAEAKRQYDQNYAALQPIVASQQRTMDDNARYAGEDRAYNLNTFRPLQTSMVNDANNFNTQANQDRLAGQAVSDVHQQAAVARGISQRAMSSMGVNPNSGRFAGMEAGNSLRETAMAAGGSTNARNQGFLTGQALKSNAVGLGQGLSGAGATFSGMSTNAGNAAAGNQMAPGGAYMTGLGQGAGTMMQGAGINAQGRTSMYNTQTSNQSDGGLGAIVGLAGTLGAAYMTGGTSLAASDRRLKENIVRVGGDNNTGLNLYEFSYKDNPSVRYRGVMADEVEDSFPDAVLYGDDGFALVNYGMLGIEMTEVQS